MYMCYIKDFIIIKAIVDIYVHVLISRLKMSQKKSEK